MKYSYDVSEIEKMKKGLIEGIATYDKLQNDIKNCIEECCGDFLNNYTKEKITSADDFVMYSIKCLERSIRYISFKIYSELNNEYGEKLMAECSISEKDLQQYFCNTYLEQSEVIRCIKAFMYEVRKMDANINLARLNDEINKANRGRVVGGGYGIKGSIMGMAMAGIANAMIGTGYGAVNKVADIKRQARRDNKIANVILNNDLRNVMKNSLKNDLFYFYELNDSLSILTSRAATQILEIYGIRI